MLSSTTVTNINNKKSAISILEWFLKDHVIPKTVVMMLKIQFCPHRNKWHFKIYNRKKIEIGCKIRDFFRPQILVYICAHVATLIRYLFELKGNWLFLRKRPKMQYLILSGLRLIIRMTELTSHLKGFSPECWRECTLRDMLRLKDFPHVSQVNGMSLVWAATK